MSNDTICPQCEKDFLVPGYAIDPGYQPNCRSHYPRANLTAKDIHFIFVWKCPVCGHCEEADQTDSAFKTPPAPYTTWLDYWKAL